MSSSLYIPSASARELFSGIEVAQLGSGLSPIEIAEFAGTLVIPAHVDMAGSEVAQTSATAYGAPLVMRRTPTSPREPWAPDHHWHTDRVYWGENHFASILYAQKLAGTVAGTEFIDTSLLLDAVERDNPGTTEALRSATTVFSVAKYFRDVLPLKGSREAITATLLQKQSHTLAEVADKEAEKYPPKRFPTLPAHPFRTLASLMIDEARTINIENTDLSPQEVQSLLAKLIQNYLALPPEELHARPYYKLHTWEEGQVIIMPQIGVLHRAQASPKGEHSRFTIRQFIG